MPQLWAASRGALTRLGLADADEITIGAAYLVLSGAIGMALHLPLEVYSTFGVEARFGFNKQTLGGFVRDKLKSIALQLVLGLPVAVALLWVVRWGG